MDGLDRSTTRWNVIPQQIMMARVDRMPGDTELFGMDIWSGYEVARRRLMEFLATRRPANPIVLTGDIHSNWVNDLKVDYENENAPVVGTEFVGTSISSGGDGSDVLGRGGPRLVCAGDGWTVRLVRHGVFERAGGEPRGDARPAVQRVHECACGGRQHDIQCTRVGGSGSRRHVVRGWLSNLLPCATRVHALSAAVPFCADRPRAAATRSIVVPTATCAARRAVRRHCGWATLPPS